jgi:hypothetical protein
MYEHLSDEDLARTVSETIGLSYDSALRAIRSDDSDLGRSWAIMMLQRESRHEETQARLTHHLEALRSVGV